MSAVTLYELADLRAIIDEALDASEGELTPEIEVALTAWEGQFEDKAERVALYIVEQEHLATLARSEAKALHERAAAREKRAASLKQYLQLQLERVGKTKINGVLKTIALQKNPPSVVPVVILDEADLRNLFMFVPEFVTRVPESYGLNKRAILDAAKTGTLPEDIQKRVTVVQTISLRIR